MTRRKFSDAEITDCVRRAIAGEASPETLVCRLIYGRDPKNSEPAWPAHHRAVWVRAVDVWIRMRGAAPVDEMKKPLMPSLARVWAEIEAVTNGGRDYPTVANLSWPDLGSRLGMGDRAVMYYLATVQGWRFRGKGKRRRIEAAPCVKCEQVFPAKTLVNALCPSCDPDREPGPEVVPVAPPSTRQKGPRRKTPRRFLADGRPVCASCPTLLKPKNKGRPPVFCDECSGANKREIDRRRGK